MGGRGYLKVMTGRHRTVLPKSAWTHEPIHPSPPGMTERERGWEKKCVLSTNYPCYDPVLVLGDAPRNSHLHPQLFLSQDTLVSSARTPTPEPSITKVNLLLKDVVRRVSILPSFAVHLPEGALSHTLHVAYLCSDTLGCHVVAGHDFRCVYLWGVTR